MNPYALLIGAATAVIVVIHLRATKRENTRWAYPLLLATFPAFYWAFAVYASDYVALARELMAAAGFLAIAYVACKFRSTGTLLLLAVGYGMHAVYDVSHDLWFLNAGTPAWWPEFCGSIDLMIAGYVAYLALRRQGRPSPA